LFAIFFFIHKSVYFVSGTSIKFKQWDGWCLIARRSGLVHEDDKLHSFGVEAEVFDREHKLRSYKQCPAFQMIPHNPKTGENVSYA
jgi:hypothetical protein